MQMLDSRVYKTNREAVKFVLAIIGSSVAYYYSTGFHDNWLLTWLAPLPLCVYAFEASPGSCFVAGFVAYFAGSLNQFGYLPVSAYLASSAMNAAVFALLLKMYRHVAIQSRPMAASLLLASGWAAYEFVTSLYSSYGTFQSIAYTQIANLPIIQIASITGIWGITFLLVLVPSSLAMLWRLRHAGNSMLKMGAIPAGVLLLTLAFGFYRLYVPVEGPSIRIGLAAVPTTIERLRSQDPEQVADTIRQYVHITEQLAHSGAQVVLLPEKVAVLPPGDKTVYLRSLSDAARKNRVTVIVGMTDQDDHTYNCAYVFSPDGQFSLRYAKQHLLPAFEGNYTRGNALGMIKTQDTGIWGIEICKDLDFARPSRDYSLQGANLIFVPALDFHADNWLHARIAIMRGVEGGYAVARAAQWGDLTLTDSRGRVVAIASTDARPGETLLIGDLKVGEGKSVYSQMGDWLGWTCTIFFCIFAFRLGLGAANRTSHA